MHMRATANSISGLTRVSPVEHRPPAPHPQAFLRAILHAITYTSPEEEGLHGRTTSFKTAESRTNAVANRMLIITKLSLFSCALVVSLASILAGCATPPTGHTTDANPRLQRAVAMLAVRTDADSLAAAGLLSLPTRRDKALSLIARAVEAAPDRPDLVWLQAQVCHESPPCDPEPIDLRIRELDPSNGAGWMGAIARADVLKDDAATNDALAAISHTDRVDIYWTTLIAHLGRATVQTKTLSPWLTEVTIIGILAAQAVPAYAPISRACKGERLQRPEIVEVCQGVARAFEHGDTYITEMIGVAIAKRVWPEDSAEWRAAAEERRVYDYRSKYYAQLEFWYATHAEQTLSMYAKNRREQDVLLAQLVATGKNPNPPLAQQLP
jgi:hypothetical protein